MVRGALMREYLGTEKLERETPENKRTIVSFYTAFTWFLFVSVSKAHLPDHPQQTQETRRLEKNFSKFLK